MTEHTRSDQDRQELLEIAQEAYIWGSPLVQWGWYRRLRDYWYIPLNRPFGRLGVLDDEFAPSQELLYTLLELDLRQEPQILRLPKIKDRFFSFQLCDRFFNPFTYLSTRTIGAAGGDYAVCPPGWDGDLPAGVERVDSPLDRVLTYGRTEVRGKADNEAAVAIAVQYEVSPLSTYPDGFRGHFRGAMPSALFDIFPPFRGDTEGFRFFDKLCAELREQPFAPQEQALAERFRRVGIGPGLVPTESDRELRGILKEAVRLGQEAIDGCAMTVVNGWRTATYAGPTFDDMVLRAFLQAPGGGCNIAAESLYHRCYQSPDGAPLNGAKRYRLFFPAGGIPPVDAFWSICLQGLDGIPIPNPIHRHAISSVMNDLVYGADGSLEILLQHDEPAPGVSGNWLPSSADTDYYLFMRSYLPREGLLSGDYAPPAIEVISA